MAGELEQRIEIITPGVTLEVAKRPASQSAELVSRHVRALARSLAQVFGPDWTTAR
jgi:hypothetical protein